MTILFVDQSQARKKRKRQGGIAALAMALLMLVFCAILLGGYAVLRTADAKANVEEQQQTLRWAEQAVSSFASVHGRLPCPAAARKEKEDCSIGAKGWLPVATLEPSSPTLAPGVKERLDVRYVLYRGPGTDPADADLGVVGEAFMPTLADGSAPPGYPVIISGLDLCGKLRRLFPHPDLARRRELGDPLTGGPGRQDRAHIPNPDGSGKVLNIAYGLAVQDMGRSGSGINADFSSAALEAPDRPHDAQYGDLVQAVDVHQLYGLMACATAQASIDSLAEAQALAAVPAYLKTANIASAENAQHYQGLLSGAGVLSIGSAVIDLVNSIYNIQTNAELFALAVPYDLKGMASHSNGVINAVNGLILNSTDLGRAPINAFIDGIYILVYDLASSEAQGIRVWAGGMSILEQADKIGVSNE